jgi:hypothetical protein
MSSGCLDWLGRQVNQHIRLVFLKSTILDELPTHIAFGALLGLNRCCAIELIRSAAMALTAIMAVGRGQAVI